MELTLLVQYSMLIKRYDGERNFESLFGIYVLPNIKQRTNAKKGKNRKKAQRYSMHQYIIIEG